VADQKAAPHAVDVEHTEMRFIRRKRRLT